MVDFVCHCGMLCVLDEVNLTRSGKRIIKEKNTGKIHSHDEDKHKEDKIPEDYPYQGMCVCNHWHGRGFKCSECKCDRHEFPSSSFPKKSACVILCPDSSCSYTCIDNSDFRLWEQFDSHIQKMHRVKLKQPFLIKLQNTIMHLQKNEVRDRFVQVSPEDVMDNVDSILSE